MHSTHLSPGGWGEGGRGWGGKVLPPGFLRKGLLARGLDEDGEEAGMGLRGTGAP